MSISITSVIVTSRVEQRGGAAPRGELWSFFKIIMCAWSSQIQVSGDNAWEFEIINNVARYATEALDKSTQLNYLSK